jgi:Putative metal-binding motif/Calx-beta domain
VATQHSSLRKMALTNGDVISVAMTSSISCASPSTVTSNLMTMTVNPNLPQTVSIEASATTICFGQMVTFTTTPVNAGSDIVYEWMVNNNAVGSNSPVYQSSSLANGDKIQVSMVSTQTCGGRNQVFSNLITINVNSALTPSVTIGASAIDICAGTNVTFMATPTNGGSTPSYQWKLNGSNVGTNSATYQNSSLNNADTIRVVMTTSLSCAGSPSATSNYISMDVTQPVSPSVSITASSTSICSGQSISFNATPTNGGASPVYQWKINGAVAGTNSSTFQTSSLSNSDVVSVSMTSSLPCVTAPLVNSNSISIAVLQQITYYADLDGDGYGNSNSGMIQSCNPQTGYVANNSDCNDNNASVHPGATDICGNSIDDDCDGQTDEGCESPDNDNDGYTVGQGDCNDNNALVNPGATEVCGNSIDDNCNAQTDENCTDSLPTLITKTYPVKEGDAGYTIVNVEVKLDKPARLPISVNYATNNANATAGSDYVATNGTLSIPVGAISGIIQIKVIGDLLREDNESFWLGFSNPVNFVLGSDPRTRIMIIDNDKGKPNSATPTKEMLTEAASFKIPTVVKRNTVWMIPQISYYENEVLVMNVQGQIVSRFINYKNQTSIGNVAAGLYFYKIRIRESDGQHKFYSGRLLITE